MKDKLSALLDGELEDEAVGTLCGQIGTQSDLKADWQCWCLIGDALRDGQGGGQDRQEAFVAAADLSARVLAALEEEPTVLAPGALRRARRHTSVVTRLMPLAASLMGVAAVGFVAASLFSQSTPAPVVASAQPLPAASLAASAPAPVARSEQGAVVRRVAADDALSEYLIAHQGVSAGAMSGGGVQYVRTVSLAAGGGR